MRLSCVAQVARRRCLGEPLVPDVHGERISVRVVAGAVAAMARFARRRIDQHRFDPVAPLVGIARRMDPLPHLEHGFVVHAQGEGIGCQPDRVAEEGAIGCGSQYEHGLACQQVGANSTVCDTGLGEDEDHLDAGAATAELGGGRRVARAAVAGRGGNDAGRQECCREKRREEADDPGMLVIVPLTENSSHDVFLSLWV